MVASDDINYEDGYLLKGDVNSNYIITTPYS